MISAILAFLLAAGAAQDGDLEIAAERVGPITSRTVLTTTSLAPLFPGGRIEHFETAGIGGFKDGGRGWNVWTTGKELTLTIVSDARGRCWTVNVLGRSLRTREGLRVGSKVDDLLVLGGVRCRRSPEEEGELLACARQSVPNVEFLFVPTATELNARGVNGEMPATFAPERHTDRRVELILWSPPTQRSECR